MDNRLRFDQFFQLANGNQPYLYQCRLACGDPPPAANCDPNNPDWLTRDWLCRPDPKGCASRLIKIPTGLGKTAAVVLAWLWNRIQDQSPKWPRRLVYCLPMRTLVEQTRDEVLTWLGRLALVAVAENSDGWLRVRKALIRLPAPIQARIADSRSGGAFAQELALGREELVWLFENSPVILMGGEELDGQWDIYPEKPAVLIGTQDMLLSRALNRGYGMSRYRWPMHFGLLNNDCLWVMDETQLMGVGLETTVQLAGFRDRFGTLAPCVNWWMSATLESERLATPEAPSRPIELQLDNSERQLSPVRRRLNAGKRLARADTALTDDVASYAKALADEVLSSHAEGTLSLVIVNSVERAQAVFREIRKKAAATLATLLHSRFRPYERRQLMSRGLESTGDHIIVSTQVVEAGVDLSARTLFTELAPWSSLVQRFGRCHRHGEMPTGADIRWVDVPETDAAPYAPRELAASRQLLQGLSEVSLATLAGVASPPVPETFYHIVRPKDVRELFDTTPDIAGADLDVSRFIRDAKDVDCLVFWREMNPSQDEEGVARDELCPVPVVSLGEMADKRRDDAVWVWDALARQWVHPQRFVPGRTYRLAAALGGYDPALGFDRRSKAAVIPVAQAAAPPESLDDDRGTTLPKVETLEEHTTAVVAHTVELCNALGLPDHLGAALRLTANWHDAGKAHPVFQAALRRANPALDSRTIYAKSGTTARLEFVGRPHFRHELASALAFRALAAARTADRTLVSYLVAAHHGKVRLSLRALPGEEEPPPRRDGRDALFARGVWDGDVLLSFALHGQTWPETTLSLGSMQIGVDPHGEPSWLESCLSLCDSPDLGPFRLALLEVLVRAADMRASSEAGTERTLGELR